MRRFYFLFYSVSEFSRPPVPTQLNQIEMYLEDPRSFICCIVSMDLGAAENKARRALHAISGEAYTYQIIPEWIYKRVCENEIRYNF